MTSIGIGKLQHAKADRTHQGLPQQEGQLSVDVLHDDQEILVICPIAGVEESGLQISLQDNMLTIRGSRKPPADLHNKSSVVKEVFWGTFSRSIMMPDHIDAAHIQAKVSDHLLFIRIPKTEQYKTRYIPISTE